MTLGLLASHLPRARVFTGLPAVGKEDLLRELIHRTGDTGAFGDCDATTVLRAVLKRERVGSTGIGRGVGIPHCKTPSVPGPVVAYGRAAEAIDFGATDGEPVHSLFLVVSRPEDADMHVALLKAISKAVRDDYYARILRNTADADLLHDLFRDLDGIK